jgi:hypothetical protein
LTDSPEGLSLIFAFTPSYSTDSTRYGTRIAADMPVIQKHTRLSEDSPCTRSKSPRRLWITVLNILSKDVHNFRFPLALPYTIVTSEARSAVAIYLDCPRIVAGATAGLSLFLYNVLLLTYVKNGIVWYGICLIILFCFPFTENSKNDPDPENRCRER